MKKITIVWTITILIIVGGLTIIGFKYKEKNGSNIMEKSLVTQTQKYFGLYPGLYPSKGSQVKITNDELKEEGYDAELDDDCTGYVVIEYADMGYTYNAYIKCPDYTTKGYTE
jgi:hypothetical protein